MELREKLASEIGKSFWEDLFDFTKKGTLILLDNSVDLLEAGLYIANDNANEIEKLIADNKLSRPNFQAFEDFKDNEFDCLIIQPFVLCKLRPQSDN